MASNYLSIISALIGVPLWTLVILIIWSATWKLLALWKSARQGSLIWFILLAVFNTAGILPILYIFVFSKMECCQLNRKTSKKTPARKVARKKTSKKR